MGYSDDRAVYFSKLSKPIKIPYGVSLRIAHPIRSVRKAAVRLGQNIWPEYLGQIWSFSPVTQTMVFSQSPASNGMLRTLISMTAKVCFAEEADIRNATCRGRFRTMGYVAFIAHHKRCQ